MPVPRRALLTAVPAGTLLLAAAAPRARAAGGCGAAPAAGAAPGSGAVPASGAGSPAAGTAADRAVLAANALAILTGTAESNARPEVAGKLAAVEAAARARLAAMAAAGTGEVFHGLPLGTSDANLSSTFRYLNDIALATRVPGPDPSDLRGSAAVQTRVIDALAALYDGYYGDQSRGYYGNWFTWEIGISSAVSTTLLLLQDSLAARRPDLTAAYVAAMDGYLRNGKNGDVDLDSRFHTGANLADITTNRVLQGVVTADDARIAKAVSDQLTVYATVDPYAPRHGVTDGFYADGSFIQHASVAYTGSYGTGLLGRVVQTVKMLDGTAYAQGADLVGTVLGWITEGFAPLVFEGWMMEPVKGRAVSRTTTGYADASAVIQAVTDLTGYTSGDRRAALAGYVKSLHDSSRAAPDPAAFASPVTTARYAAILADPCVTARDLNDARQHTAFNAMERTVHRRPGYAFALARSSTRISAYEYMSGENLMPWFQGAGAHYLYLSGQDQTQAYGVDYFTTVSPYRLAGVTAPVEQRLTVPELYGTAWYDNPAEGFTASSQAQNAYVYFPRCTNEISGGARLGAYGTAALVQADDAAYAAEQAGLLPDDFTAYRAADATKSWFMLDDEIVVLAAGAGDSAGRAVTTTADARTAAATATVALTGALRGGARWTGPGTAPLAWLRFADADQGIAVGYAFLDGGIPVTAALETVTRSRRSVRTANHDTAVTRQVFTVGYEQPAGSAHTAMAWAIVPHATERQLARYARGPLGVLANSTRLQAVRHTRAGILAANSFTPGRHRVRRLSWDGPASVIVQEARDGTVSLAVSDPTTRRDSVSLLLRGRPLRPLTADSGVEVRRAPGGTRVGIATRHAYGKSFTATLR
jgi:hyaluronate lyase